MNNEWDERFDSVLREYLVGLAVTERLQADRDLRSLGLDSMGMVQVLLDLEDVYQVTLPEDALNDETFSTPAKLWHAVSTATSV